MTVVTVPAAIRWVDLKVKLLRKTEKLTSQYSGRSQVIVLPYALWVVEGGLIPYEAMDAGPIRSFLVKLEGSANTARVPVAGSETPLSLYSGTPGATVGIVAAGATTIPVDGVTPTTTIVKEGDFFNVGDELKMAMADAISDGAGAVSIQCQPPMREDTVNNEVVAFEDVFIYCNAVDDDIATWVVTAPVEHAISMKLVEAFR